MKKLLISAAVCGLALSAAPAHAQVKLDLGGYFKGYGMWTDLDEDTITTSNDREFDIVRNTEIHFGGETTLDNGLTVGFHAEAQADGTDTASPNDSFDVNESYAYFSGSWGRFNVGSEDGAAYLLQVAAPSADENLDGLRQYVNPVRYASMGVSTSFNVADSGSSGGLDYDQDQSGTADKVTYLSPIFSGFQFGLSYTPDVADLSTENSLNLDDVDNTFGMAWDVGARYEGQFNNVGFAVGGGWTHVDLEQEEAGGPDATEPTDDRDAWNIGLDLNIGAFGIGAAYTVDDFGQTDTLLNAAEDTIDDERTWVVGVDYTSGPFRFGGSYMNKDAANNLTGTDGTNGTDGVEVDRFTGGLVYTYGPGMTFRGSVSRVNFDNVSGTVSGDDSPDATSFLFGTQIDF